ncbi:thioesterase family protein [Metapseudomonas lalkuanensis]|uniref:Thioesterase family protein n=1 Tax=Metapseudomonas lalkuanensis TaxID=2604832 RepID=A0A5J6QPL8_9GAMM|nr:acyl-CoA thioesterase domain-containing protein [Pseudomonas lalkuanensis]QEY63622.1 thioesterase family protein [Pseudomonas lalkuanensis]UCP00335.1 thioesterase family protein [Pseudomonas lalkuanensis]
MNFSELIQAARRYPGEMVVPATWGQGRAVFGGVVAALAFEAMRAKVEPGRPVRSLAMTFVGPLEPEVPANFEAELLREGKAVSQVFCRVVQKGQVVALVQGSFGGSRQSVVQLEAEPAPEMKPVADCFELPFIPGVTPEFTRHLAMRWSIGGLPFSNSRERDMGGWVRFRGDVVKEVVTESHLLALVDAWPPATVPHLPSPVPGSTLTWTIEFVQPLPKLDTHDWCKYRARIEHARDGYGHAAAALWSPEGELVAMSRQTVVVFG